MTKRHFGIAFSILGLLISTGCSSGSDGLSPASVDVSWQIGGASCGAVGVSTVRISLINETGIYTTETVACQLGKSILSQVPPGLYDVQIDGFRAGTNSPSHRGSLLGVDVRPGSVTVLPRVELSEVPGGLDVTWKFEDGDLCAFAGVDTVVINIWDGHNNRIYEEGFPCDPQLALVEAETRDPTRALYNDTRGIVIDGLYAGQYTLRAFAIKAGTDLHPKFWAENKPVVTHAALSQVNLTLSPCEVTQADGSVAQISICY